VKYWVQRKEGYNAFSSCFLMRWYTFTGSRSGKRSSEPLASSVSITHNDWSVALGLFRPLPRRLEHALYVRQILLAKARRSLVAP
jgi:hypothetical protein